MANKYLDNNGLLYLWTKIKNYVTGITNNKVDKVDGKGLSTHDLTDELLEKIQNAGDSSFSGNYPDLTSKPKINNVEIVGDMTLNQLGIQAKGDYALKSEIPTLPTKVSQLQNDTDYQTGEEVEAAVASKAEKTYVDTELGKKANATHTHVKADITDFPVNVSSFSNDAGYQNATQVTAIVNEKISEQTHFTFQKVEELPDTSSASANVIYLVAKDTPGTSAYDEYLLVDGAWELIGNTDVDLSGYMLKTDMTAITNGEIDDIISA